MKRLNCKLIVSDFDGTLANTNNEVPQEVIDKINSYVKNGGIFAVCTGRIMPSILPRVRDMGLTGLVIASQGSQIAEIESGKILREACFLPEQTAEICEALEELDSNVQIYNIRGFYSSLPEGEKHLALYESIIGVKGGHSEEKLSRFALTCGESFCKVAALCRPEEQEELFAKLTAKFGGKYDVTCSAKVLVEISPQGETKGAALEFLAKHYGVPLSQTCAIGDNLNDLSMIETAGYGVAVANSAQGLLDRTKYKTVSNDEGAVARVIETFGYINND